MGTGEEAMSVVNIDMELVEEAERHYRIREDLAREDWQYAYRHTLPQKTNVNSKI